MMQLPDFSALGLRTPPTGTLFIRPINPTCSICFEPLFGCAGKDERPADAKDDVADEDDWSLCLADNWAMRKDGPDVKNVISLRCGHVFHAGCMSKWIRARREVDIDAPLECPFCRSQTGISNEVLEDLGLPREEVEDMLTARERRNNEARMEAQVANGGALRAMVAMVAMEARGEVAGVVPREETEEATRERRWLNTIRRRMMVAERREEERRTEEREREEMGAEMAAERAAVRAEARRVEREAEMAVGERAEAARAEARRVEWEAVNAYFTEQEARG